MKLFYILVLVLLFQCSFATTYYISTKGNDATGNGSISNPWQTLYKATSVVTTAGDIIHVNAGTYTETQQIILAVGVSIEGDGITSIIKSRLTAEWTALLTAKSDTEGTNGDQYISNLKFDGQNLSTFWAITVIGRKNFSIHNCTISDFKDRGVIFAGRIDNANAAPAIYATGNSFHDNIMTNCAGYLPNQYGSGALNIGGQDGMLIYNNTITQNSRPQGHNGWPIKYWNDGYLNGCKIYNNKLTKIPMGNSLGVNGWDFAIELFNESGLEIRGNTIQGAIDLNFQTKGTYDYSAWIHDNTISQLALNKYVESGITFEFSTDAAIIENNHMRNVGFPVYFTPREGNFISNVTIKNNICENIGVAGGTHQGFAVQIGNDGNNIYTLTNLFISNNKFQASTTEKPYWGIGILGISKANNIQIRNNTITGFSAGCITASPGSAIDTMIVENNIFSGNGYANRPVFVNGEPLHYVNKNNSLSNPSIFSFINIKMNIIRSFYYELKYRNMLEFIAVFAFIMGIWFSRKENIYVYPMLLINLVISVFLSLENSFPGEAGIFLYFIIMGIYGWVMWAKRDRKKHRIIRITSSVKKERLIQPAFFAAFFMVNFFVFTYYKNLFSPGTVPWAAAFASASAFTGMWLMTRKKVESWYWWIAANIISIPLSFIKYQLFMSGYYMVLLVMAVWSLFEWKRRRVSKRRVQL